MLICEDCGHRGVWGDGTLAVVPRVVGPEGFSGSRIICLRAVFGGEHLGAEKGGGKISPTPGSGKDPLPG